MKPLLESVLEREIPLSAAMGLQVMEASLSQIVLSAPLKPNLNHLSTAFGGSLYSLLVLAGWSWIWLRMQEDGLQGQIMIRSACIDYAAPVSSDFSATCQGAEAASWQRAARLFQKRGMAKICLESWVESGGKRAVSFQGDYALVR
jgi:thioesterase domain-containing protein